MTLRVVVVAEDRMGLALARDLCDRVVRERGAAWLAELWEGPEASAQQREWAGFDRADEFTTWSGLKDEARRRGLRSHPLGLRASAAEGYKAVQVALLQPDDRKPDLLVLARDTEGAANARAEMTRGAATADPTAPAWTLHAVAHQESEAWAIAGYEPRDAHERRLLDAERARLGFDPVREPHRLTPKNPTDPRDAKRVRTSLGLGDHRDARTIACWRETPLDTLRTHGEGAGLRAYLDDVERVVLPLLGDVRRDG